MTANWTSPIRASLAHRLGLARLPFALKCDYKADGFGTRGKSLKFLSDPAFDAAWRETAAAMERLTGTPAPDLRWRAHIALWAARQGLLRQGDFMECGVFTGVFAQMICRTLDLAGRNFWLFDTWDGIPDSAAAERAMAEANNKTYRARDVFADVQNLFSQWPACRPVRGLLPGTLAESGAGPIAFLSMDLNNAGAERACIAALWPRLVPGAIVLVDDYAWSAHRAQQDMWDDFAASKTLSLAALPTGQGLLVKP